jgi:hypothetical protein
MILERDAIKLFREQAAEHFHLGGIVLVSPGIPGEGAEALKLSQREGETFDEAMLHLEADHEKLLGKGYHLYRRKDPELTQP